METIFALASGAGKAGVAVVRISGTYAPQALEVLGGRLPKPRLASLQRLKDNDNAFLDEALVLYFESGASFTGEDVVELQLHGSMAIVRKVLDCLAGVEGCRLAEPGEFTRRAMDAGRIDLAQVEGLADLIDAETEFQRKQALRIFDGDLSSLIEEWRDQLIEARALLEVTIDFADEDVPVDVSDDVQRIVNSLIGAMQRSLKGMSANKAIREGFEVAIIGAPNVGKSTLLNHLAGREVALTSEIAGTTRDVIEVKIDLNGLPVTFLDTAGLRETDDVVEAMGVRLTEKRSSEADLRLHLMESDLQDLPPNSESDVFFVGKDDLGASSRGVSGRTGSGVSDLLNAVSSRLEELVAGASLVGRKRHADSLVTAIERSEKALEKLSDGPDGYDLCSEDIRLASISLQSILGGIDVEQVYDVIFGRFCLGK